MKKQKGITLVALIITIIVMLILAGVAISLVTGEKGVMTQAETAKLAQANAEEEERVSLAILNAKTSKLSSNSEIEFNEEFIKGAVEKEFGTGSCAVKEETDCYVVTMLNSNNKYEISKLEKGNTPIQVSIEGKYGDDSVSTGTSSDFEYYIFNNDGTGEYCEDHESPRSFEYVLQNDANGSITFEDSETIQFMFEGTNQNKIIYIKTIGDYDTGYEYLKAYTTNGKTDLSVIENTKYKLYDNDEYFYDLSFNGEVWKIQATVEDEDTGELVDIEVVQNLPYFIKEGYIYVAESDGKETVIYKNVFNGYMKIIGDSIYTYSS